MAKGHAYYIPGGEKIEVGSFAFIEAVTHPQIGVSPDTFLTTSRVKIYDASTGWFETENTVYEPIVRELAAFVYDYDGGI